MIVPDRLAGVTAAAAVPEQVVPYACAVAGSKPQRVGPCVGYASEGEFVLVGYPLHDPRDTGAMVDAVDQALKLPSLRRITVIGSVRPPQAPAGSPAEEDGYVSVPVPHPPPAQKLRNLMRRARRELVIERDQTCGGEHMALIQPYLDGRHLAAGTRHIFRQIPRYLEMSSGSLMLSARLSDGRLAAFSVGEFGSLHTAFYMFCFRHSGLAPPGSTDLLLSALLEEARERGQVRMNLGLGVNAGVRFFKRKWGAEPFLPYVQVSWEPAAPKMFRRLRGFFGG
ncbi:MAG: translation initiation factor IF-2 [Deltaproteobacteria bacterium]|nr:translation initiation factor IF-2 [Deltaproteobacteria bacterium]